GNIEVDHSTPLVSEDQEDIENMERDGRDREEVNRNKFLAVIFEKRAPGLRGWLWTPDHVLGNGRLRELDSEFEDFSMNPRSSPKRTLLMLRITSRTSLGIEGLPARPCRLFQV